MVKQVVTAGIDIGSNQICCVAGICDESTGLIKVLSSMGMFCDGVKAGTVVNIQETAACMCKILEETEKTINERIKNIVVAVRGNLIKSRHATGVVNMENIDRREITQEIVGNALDNAKQQIKLDPEQEILQIVPLEYILNQQKGIHNPIGMEGTYIEVDVCTFLISSNNLRNLSKVFSTIGIHNVNKVYGYPAIGEVLITKEEKELGCLLIDFGGLTIGLVHYVNGVIAHTDEILDGSDYITRDIGYKLKTNYSIAREIKEMYGAAFVHHGFENKEFEYTISDGTSSRIYDRFTLVNYVIMPRIDRILYKVKKVIEKNNYGDEVFSGGIILSGGGSNLHGLTEAFEKVFSCSVRVGTVGFNKFIVGPRDILSNFAYTTAIGTLRYGFMNNHQQHESHKKKTSKKSKIVSKISEWLEEIF
ncbi:MAG: cell division protein FtsA [Endomicrobium sp.]|jgi:cell division protein FtsA|nr:cell division protein FtsA [Endomicrobium sp.]